MTDRSADTAAPQAAPAPDGLRARINALTSSDRFRNAIMGVIVFNALILGIETSPTAMSYAGGFIHFVNSACLMIFVAEICLKLYGQRLRFFVNAWNIFDFLIVGIAIMPSAGGLSVLRALRVLRIFRVITTWPKLRRVVEGFITALPGMASVMLLMLVIFYIGAVMATNLFGGSHPQWFGTVGESLYSLFQIMTLESWSMGIVRPVMEVHPQAWAFFVPFITLTSFMTVNLVVGLIVNSMQDAATEEETEATDSYRETVIEKLEAIERRLSAMEAAPSPDKTTSGDKQ